MELTMSGSVAQVVGRDLVQCCTQVTLGNKLGWDHVMCEPTRHE